MSFRPAVNLFGVVFCLAVAGWACSSHGPSSKDGGADAPAEMGAGGSAADTGADVVAPALDCQGIRLCLSAGGTATDCAARGTAEARAAFQPLFDCLTANCPDQSAACFCREACQQPDGYCLDQTDACVAASKTDVDAVCGQFCGG